MGARRLSERQRRFIDYYLMTLNATEAAQRAGYSAKCANQIGPRNMKNPAIKAAITERLKQLDDARIAQIREVLERVTSVARRELTDEVVVTEGTGHGETRARVITKRTSIHDQITALKILFSYYGLAHSEEKNHEEGGVTIVDDTGPPGER